MATTAFIQYGSYNHAPGEAMFHIEIAAVIGKTGRIEFHRHRWTITGWIAVSSPSDASTKIAALEAAYLSGGQNLKFKLDGSTDSAHVLLTADCLNGTEVRPLQWLGISPQGSKTQYLRKRNYRIVVTGDIDPEDQDSDIVYWTETIHRLGTGGTNYEWPESIAGSVASQQTNAFTRCMTIQEGFALGRTDYPDPAAALWGSPYLKPRPTGSSPISPRDVFRNAQRNYGRRWKYHYESDTPLVGGPTEFTP